MLVSFYESQPVWIITLCLICWLIQAEMEQSITEWGDELESVRDEACNATSALVCIYFKSNAMICVYCTVWTVGRTFCRTKCGFLRNPSLQKSIHSSTKTGDYIWHCSHTSKKCDWVVEIWHWVLKGPWVWWWAGRMNLHNRGVNLIHVLVFQDDYQAKLEELDREFKVSKPSNFALLCQYQFCLLSFKTVKSWFRQALVGLFGNCLLNEYLEKFVSSVMQWNLQNWQDKSDFVA